MKNVFSFGDFSVDFESMTNVLEQNNFLTHLYLTSN